jgi:hypothetical protein
MTSVTDIYNLALQTIGTRTVVTDAQVANNSSNEAIQLNLVYPKIRDDILRLAPWDCGIRTANLTYITSSPGTPENTSAATTLWQPGQPPPPWAYEYQYPVDCLRACWIIPATQTGFAGGVPITTAVTGGASAFWQGQPVTYKVQTDKFCPVTAAAVVSGGAGYSVGDTITLATVPNTQPPIGAPAQLTVTGVSGGAVTSVDVVNVIAGSATPQGGSYFNVQPNPVAQGSTDGNGSGATFNLTQGQPSPQRIILTNQEFATLAYVQQVTDPNVFDPLFQTALFNALGAAVCQALTGDKTLVKNLVQMVNQKVEIARSIDGNEGLTVNDVTPDWIRIRGINWTDGYISGPYTSYDWGNYWSFT